MKRIGLGIVTAIGLLALVAGAVWLQLRLPVPLQPTPQGVILSDVTVINPGESRTAGRRVVTEGDRIASIEAVADAVDAGSPYAGAYVLPGLTDMHVHLPLAQGLRQMELFAFRFLQHGVTTVRDAGSFDGSSLEYRRRERAGEFVGPRIYACGPIIDGDPPLWPDSKVARDAVEAAAIVAELAELGVDCLKAYSGLSRDAAQGLLRAARAHGLPVIGHVPRSVRYDEALVDDAQHLLGLPAEQEADLRDVPARLAPWNALGEERIERIVAATLRHDLTNTPTLVTMHRLARLDDYESLRVDPAALMLPRFYRDVVWNPEIGLPLVRQLGARDFAAMRETEAARFRFVRALYEAGTRLQVGTDVQIPFIVPGASLHDEMYLLVRAGIPPEAVWAMATRGPAKMLGVPDHGRIQVGAAADLLVFREDPTRDLAALATLEAVIAQGRLYPKEQFTSGDEVYRRHFESYLFDRFSIALTKRVMAEMFANDD